MMTDDNAEDRQPDWQQWHNKAGRSDYHPETFGCYIASNDGHAEHQKAFIARLGLEQVY